MVLANNAKSVEAVEGLNDRPDCIVRPYRGCITASISQIPEKKVEYTESIKTEIDSHLALEECIS